MVVKDFHRCESVGRVREYLVCAGALAHGGEDLDESESELLALHAGVDDDVLDVAYGACAAEELAFEEDGGVPHQAVRLVLDDDDGQVARPGGIHCAQVIKSGGPCVLADVWSGGERAEELQVAASVVGRRERTQREPARQRCSERGRQQTGIVQILVHGSRHPCPRL